MSTTQPSSTEAQAKEPRDLRLRNQYFPDAGEQVFDTGKKGFVPMPIIMRKLMRHLTPPELRVLIYLQTRCSRYFICYPTLEEMAHDLRLAGRRNLTPHIKSLAKKKFIATASGGGKTYFLVLDPRVTVTHLVESRDMNEDDLFEINEVLRDLKQDAITARPKPAEPLKRSRLRFGGRNKHERVLEQLGVGAAATFVQKTSVLSMPFGGYRPSKRRVRNGEFLLASTRGVRHH